VEGARKFSSCFRSPSVISFQHTNTFLYVYAASKKFCSCTLIGVETVHYARYRDKNSGKLSLIIMVKR
jgi:hypothetical protein